MIWTETGNGWEATPAPGCVANIRVTDGHSGTKWKLTLTGRAGSALSAQSRLESLVDQLGVEVDQKATDQPLEAFGPGPPS